MKVLAVVLALLRSLVSATSPTTTPRNNIATGTIDLLNGLPSPTDYHSTVLYHMNIHRLNHSSGLLTYNMDLANDCGAVTRACEAAATMPDLGNWYGSFSSGVTNATAAHETVQGIVSWYDGEFEKYVAASQNFTSEPDMTSFEGWGHLTAVLWKAATHVGCWANSCPKGSGYCGGDWTTCWTVMCKFDAENMVGDFLENVLPPLGLPYDGNEPAVN